MLLIKIKASFESREVFIENSQSSAFIYFHFLKFKQIGSRKCFLPTGLVKISFPPPERPSFCRIPLKLGKVQISPLSSSGGFILWWIQGEVIVTCLISVHRSKQNVYGPCYTMMIHPNVMPLHVCSIDYFLCCILSYSHTIHLQIYT